MHGAHLPIELIRYLLDGFYRDSLKKNKKAPFYRGLD
jgi:hypothetical protein